ncbi:MAG: hypothetical protein JW797_11190 [Bradymonadales bacterium]|nr:hypothetical protein [Bradymonadales bacterium]
MTRRRIRVDSYSGYKADEEPRAVWLEDPPEPVMGISDRWYDPEGAYFKVRTRSGLLVLLLHRFEDDSWWLLKQEMTDA